MPMLTVILRLLRAKVQAFRLSLLQGVIEYTGDYIGFLL